jgi:flagellar assembly protein FliH
MIRALSLEDFLSAEASSPVTPDVSPSDRQPDTDAALAAFDEGYRSGWDDCISADAETNRRIASDLTANLQDISLTYAEARQDVLNCLGPLFEDIAAQLLPSLAAEAVAPVVIAELRAVADGAAQARALLIAAPAALPALERLIAEQGLPDIDLRAEPAYAEGQVSIRFGTERRDIDLSGAAHRMAEAIRSFVTQDLEPNIPAPIPKGVA